MKKLIMLALAASATFTAASEASAAQGCGRGLHRGVYGRCIPNFQGRPVVGRYYRNHGYYDGHRWYRQRYRYHRGWRYR